METLNIKSNRLQLPELVERLRGLDVMKHDIVINSQTVVMSNGQLKYYDHNGKSAHVPTMITPNAHMHRQIADKLSIPWKYYEKMKAEYGELLDINVARWFMKNKKNYLLRTYDNGGEMEGRALLSDSFKIIDHLDILMTALDAIKEEGLTSVEVDSADITDTNMYVRFVNKEAKINAPEFLKNYRNPGNLETNDGIISGFVLRNSETGQGAFQVSPRAVVLACQNGMVIDSDSYKRFHLGAKLETGTIDWSSDTKENNHKLIKSQIKDYVKHFSGKEYLQGVVDKLTGLGARELENPVEAVKNATKFCGVSEERQNDILSFFTKGGDTKASGVAQAITYYAHQQEDADLRFYLESQVEPVLVNMPKFDVSKN